jgi:hypothetical protein
MAGLIAHVIGGTGSGASLSLSRTSSKEAIPHRSGNSHSSRARIQDTQKWTHGPKTGTADMLRARAQPSSGCQGDVGVAYVAQEQWVSSTSPKGAKEQRVSSMSSFGRIWWYSMDACAGRVPRRLCQ